MKTINLKHGDKVSIIESKPFQKIKNFKLWRTQNNDSSSNRITSC